MSFRRPAILVGGCLAVAGLPASARGQAATRPDSIQLVARLSRAQGADRLPLLADLADLAREYPASALRLTGEALSLLQSSPSAIIEIRIRISRSAALGLDGSFPEALAQAEQAQQLARQAAADSLVDDARYFAASALWRMGNYAAAMARAESTFASQSPRGPSVALVRTIGLIGGIHQSEGDLDRAMERNLAGLEMAERLGSALAAAESHNRIGLIYWDLGRHSDALAAFRRALPTLEASRVPNPLGSVLNNIGLVLTELRRDREAIPYLERALALAKQTGNRFGEAKGYSNLAWAYYDLQQLDRAEGLFRRALALREEIGDKEGVVRSRGALADVAFARADTAAAIPILEGSIPLARAINDRIDEQEQVRQLAEAKAATGDTAGAFIAFRRFLELHNALGDSLQRERTAQLDARYRGMTEEQDLFEARTIAQARRDQLRVVVTASVLLGIALILLGRLYFLRVKALRAVAESEQRHRVLFQASAVPMFLVDAGARELIELNQPARQLSAADRETLPVSVERIEPDWVRRALVRALEAADEGEIALEDRWTDADGQIRWTEIRGGAVTLGRRACRLVGVRDATEERRRDEARNQEERLRSLGVLAGGIAHDFNNALTAVLGHVSLAREASPAKRAELLDAAEQAAVSAGRLTGQLLAFAKGGEPVRRPTNLGRLVRDAASMAAAGSHLRIDFEIPDDLRPAEVDRSQFGQVVSNLVINAKQATGQGGRLLVRAANVAEPEGPPMVRIDFSDNGPGIPPAIRGRVFEPYFTTKSGGSGLGLATAFTICRKHGGSLTCESTSTEGTTFSAFFPATDARPAEAEPDAAVPTAGSGRVLVLDDEPLVRSLLERMLTDWGYEVDAVAEGRAAVERYQAAHRKGTPYDLLIMDLTIPGGMGGRQAMAEILAVDPAARAIVASGYSDDPTMAHHQEAGFAAALAKPFRPADLARTVRSVLGRSALAGGSAGTDAR
ncbi:MAG: tetratricopeptide repeat protein [Gemmatimonadales bacterium]